MSENTKIQWCDHTFNPWIGCTKVSPGCAHCYAETETFARVRRALGHELWGKGAKRVRTSEANWKLPLKWNNKWELDKTMHEAMGPEFPLRRPRVFCASMADWLDDEIPIEWMADLLVLIRQTRNLDWQLLTKRPENFRSRISGVYAHFAKLKPGDEGRSADYLVAVCSLCDQWLEINRPLLPPHNVWIGASVEDQQRADERIPELLKIPARVRFLSVEPMLGPIDFGFLGATDRIKFPDDFQQWFKDTVRSTYIARCANGIHWAIFGGESGAKARPCNIEWIRDGVRRCRAAGVAPFVKQLGADVRCDNANEFDWPDDAQLEAIGNGFASCRVRLNDRKGGDMAEWPEDLRVREFPEVVR